MKSPWQFISDLANRRRQRLAKQSSDPTADGGPDRLSLPAPSEQLESLATSDDAESQPGQSTTSPDVTLQDETPIRAEASPINSVGDSREDAQATSAAPETSSATQSAIAPKANRRATRAARAAQPASRHEPDLTSVPDPVPDQMPVERTFHDDLRSVDEDIKRLRTELTDKLREQNEQLKRMLARFDRQ